MRPGKLHLIEVINLKFFTVGWLFTCLMVVTGATIIGGAFLVDRRQEGKDPN